jgi:hypothetical protein
MNLLFEFSDSEVGEVVQTDRGLCIRFAAAAAVQIDPSPPGAPIRGFARNVELLVLAATQHAAQPEHIGRIAHGRLALSGRWLTQIPIPHLAEAPVTLDINFANHETLVVTGTGLECRFAGKPNFAESLFC